MLTSLTVKNYTLIEHLNINLSEGFSVITGETGAGKSMLLGALGLILGKRADLSSIKNQGEKCVVEAGFDISSYELEAFFGENDLDYEKQTIIRREILPSGKSRAFVNDSPVTLQQLEELGGHLIDIHSQHQTRELSEEKYQFNVLDILGQNQEKLTTYQKALSVYKKRIKELTQAQTTLEESLKEREYDLFVFEELERARLKEGELEELEAEFQQLNNIELIREQLAKALQLSDNEPLGIYQGLTELKNTFSKIESLASPYRQLYERIDSVLIEFSDIFRELENLTESVSNSPERLQEVSDRLQLLYDLQKKYRVGNITELIEFRNKLKYKAISLDQLNEFIEKTQKQIELDRKELDAIALNLNKNRQKAIVIFNQNITKLLSELGMPDARFDIQLHQEEHYLSNGKDRLTFLFAANKGGQFGLLKKTASGGELSRIMLATKSILAQYQALPTIIFDEIDTGVSGEISKRMALIMKQMSQNIQIFSITHLPQIASKGAVHYKVFKSVIDQDTVSDLKVLNHQERILEIAEMLSGKNPPESALTHALSLLSE